MLIEHCRSILEKIWDNWEWKVVNMVQNSKGQGDEGSN